MDAKVEKTFVGLLSCLSRIIPGWGKLHSLTMVTVHPNVLPHTFNTCGNWLPGALHHSQQSLFFPPTSIFLRGLLPSSIPSDPPQHNAYDCHSLQAAQLLNLAASPIPPELEPERRIGHGSFGVVWWVRSLSLYDCAAGWLLTRCSPLVARGSLKMSLSTCIDSCRAIRNTRTGEKAALKKMPNVFKSQLACIRALREIRVLCEFSHENVRPLCSVVCSSITVHMVWMQYYVNTYTSGGTCWLCVRVLVHLFVVLSIP